MMDLNIMNKWWRVKHRFLDFQTAKRILFTKQITAIFHAKNNSVGKLRMLESRNNMLTQKAHPSFRKCNFYILFCLNRHHTKDLFCPFHAYRPHTTLKNARKIISASRLKQLDFGLRNWWTFGLMSILVALAFIT